jgi:hypothetical protein
VSQFVVNLIYRSEGKGLSSIAIPRFVKDVACAISINRHADLQDMNRQLHILGWYPVKLDYHALQLIMASLESESSIIKLFFLMARQLGVLFNFDDSPPCGNRAICEFG